MLAWFFLCTGFTRFAACTRLDAQLSQYIWMLCVHSSEDIPSRSLHNPGNKTGQLSSQKNYESKNTSVCGCMHSGDVPSQHIQRARVTACARKTSRAVNQGLTSFGPLASPIDPTTVPFCICPKFWSKQLPLLFNPFFFFLSTTDSQSSSCEHQLLVRCSSKTPNRHPAIAKYKPHLMHADEIYAKRRSRRTTTHTKLGNRCELIWTAPP